MPCRGCTTILIAALLVAGCGGSAGRSAHSQNTRATTLVEIRAFKFGPPTVTIKKGATVTWTNFDNAAHTATADDRGFDTQTIAHSKAHTLLFKSSGTFNYHCDFHPFMKATVIVK